jgi:hypothetical protein
MYVNVPAKKQKYKASLIVVCRRHPRREGRKRKRKRKKKAGEDIKEKSNKGIGYESRQTVDCSRRRHHHNGLHVL